MTSSILSVQNISIIIPALLSHNHLHRLAILLLMNLFIPTSNWYKTTSIQTYSFITLYQNVSRQSPRKIKNTPRQSHRMAQSRRLPRRLHTLRSHECLPQIWRQPV